MSEDKNVLFAKKELVMAAIVRAASNLVKDSEEPIERGMISVSSRLYLELDSLLHEYDTICKDIAQHEIDNM